MLPDCDKTGAAVQCSTNSGRRPSAAGTFSLRAPVRPGDDQGRER